jgi:hypothetical protein
VNPHRPGPKSFKCSERIFRLLVPSVQSRQFSEHRSVLARLLLEDMLIDHHIHLVESDRNGTFGILVETEFSRRLREKIEAGLRRVVEAEELGAVAKQNRDP